MLSKTEGSVTIAANSDTYEANFDKGPRSNHPFAQCQ